MCATDLITALDQDGPGPDDDGHDQVNELHVPLRTGKIKGAALAINALLLWGV